MTLFISWSTSDTINTLILIVYIITAIVIYMTFKGGQEQTSISLSISQHNIYYNELLDFIEDAKNIKFNSYLGDKAHISIRSNIDKSNGIDYMSLFQFTDHYAATLDRNIDDIEQIDDFRFNVLFPLERYYDRLYYFLNTILKDKILKDNHKRIIFNKVERDILQTYFRVCNYAVPNDKRQYNLSTFDTEKYKSESFYKINQFYIDNRLFQFKDLDFYRKTT
jgi:hypothetical protein